MPTFPDMLTLLVTFLIGWFAVYSTANRFGFDTRATLAVWFIKLTLTAGLTATQLTPAIDNYLQSIAALDLELHAASTEAATSRTAYSYAYPAFQYLSVPLARLIGFETLPFAIAGVNSLICLSACLYLFSTTRAVGHVSIRSPLPLTVIMFIPDLMVYSAVTSRDVLASGALFVACLAGLRLVRRAQDRNFATYAIFLATITVTGLLRGPLLLVVAAFCLILLMVQSSDCSRVSRFVLLIVTGVIPIALIDLFGRLNTTLGASPRGEHLISDTLVSPAEAELRLLTEPQLGGSNESGFSLVSLLVPDDSFQLLVFSIPRVLALLVAPIGAQNISVEQSTELLFVSHTLTASLIILFAPVLLWALLRGFRSLRRGNLEVELVLLSLLSALLAGGGPVIIHERYRLIILLPFASASVLYVIARGFSPRWPFLVGLATLTVGATFWIGRHFMGL